MSEQKTETEKPKPEFITVPVALFKPFHDFLKEYLEMFKSKQTIEDICRSIIQEHAKHLYNDLKDFVHKPPHHIEDEACFNRWTFISTVAFPEPEENDC